MPSEEQKQRWIRQIQEEGNDSPAVPKLLAAYDKFIRALARRYAMSTPRVEIDEYVQEGHIALLEAARRFDPAYGANFLSYAIFRLHRHMREARRALSEDVVYPNAVYDGLRQVRRTLSAADGIGLEVAIEKTELTGEALRIASSELLVQMAQGTTRIAHNDAAPVRDFDTEKEISLPHKGPRPDEAIQRDQARQRILDLCSVLEPRERTVIARHYGLDGPPETLTAIGKTMGLTRERVRQIRNRALDYLQAHHPEIDDWREW